MSRFSGRKNKNLCRLKLAFRLQGWNHLRLEPCCFLIGKWDISWGIAFTWLLKWVSSSSSTFCSVRCLCPRAEQSGEPGEIAGETMDSLRTTGRFAVKWVLSFIASALSLTIHCNVLNGGISQGSHTLPQKCALASLKHCLSWAWQRLSMEHLWWHVWES